jgi:hypothetical protein
MNGLIDSLLRYGDDIDAYRAHHDEMAKEIEEYMQILRKSLYRYPGHRDSHESTNRSITSATPSSLFPGAT